MSCDDVSESEPLGPFLPSSAQVMMTSDLDSHVAMSNEMRRVSAKVTTNAGTCSQPVEVSFHSLDRSIKQDQPESCRC